jgi:glycosyltransferase involved in cell wall biosynthesis
MGDSSVVFYFISSKGIGITYHLSEFATEIKKHGELNYHFLGDTKEQANGLIDKLKRSAVDFTLFEGLETHNRLAAMFKCIVFLKRKKVKVLHTQSNFQLILAVIVKLMTNCKIIHTIHSFHNGTGGWKMKLNHLFLVFICRLFVKKVCVPSRFVYDSFSGLNKKRQLIYLGYSRKVALKTSTFDSLPLKVIYCAKFYKAKNHAWLIETLAEEIENKKIQLFLPGDGAEYGSIKNMVSKNSSLNDGVYLPGWVEQQKIQELYAKSDVGVVPSNSETFGHNIIEPLSFSLPVISFPVGVVPDISASIAVQSVPFFDKSVFIKALQKMYLEKDVYQAARKEALEVYNKEFSWSSHIKKYEKLIKSC